MAGSGIPEDYAGKLETQLALVNLGRIAVHRNSFAQTVISPFCPPRPRRPVSTPLDWRQVSPSLNPSDFNLGNFERRLKKPNPWIDFFAVASRSPPP